MGPVAENAARLRARLRTSAIFLHFMSFSTSWVATPCWQILMEKSRGEARPRDARRASTRSARGQKSSLNVCAACWVFPSGWGKGRFYILNELLGAQVTG